MTILLDVPNRVTGDAGNGHRWWGTGKALALLNGIQDLSAEAVAMADDTVVEVNGVNVCHVVGNMTVGATCGDRDHVMLNRCRRGRMVESVLCPVAVGAILWLAGDPIADGVLDLLPCAAMTFETGVFTATEGHDMDDTGGAGVSTVMARGAEGMCSHVVHVATPGLDMADRTIRWRIVEWFMGWLLGGVGNGEVDQVVMVAAFTIDDSAAGFTTVDGI